MSSIADAGVVTVSDTASLCAFFRWASWASTRWDCLRDFEGFEDSLLEAGLFVQLHFSPIMGDRNYTLKAQRMLESIPANEKTQSSSAPGDLPPNIGRNAKAKLVAFPPETGQHEAEALFNNPFAQIALGL